MSVSLYHYIPLEDYTDTGWHIDIYTLDNLESAVYIYCVYSTYSIYTYILYIMQYNMRDEKDMNSNASHLYVTNVSFHFIHFIQSGQFDLRLLS